MSKAARAHIAPGGSVGILGGGQLGRMMALAAAPLGYKVHIYCPDADSPAAQVADACTVAAYTDTAALAGFAQAVDVVTLEFENIPHHTVATLSEHVSVRPGWKALHISQNRLREKEFVTGLNIATAPYRAVGNRQELETAVAELGRPAILKTTELGYDGKGQIKIGPATDLTRAWEQMNGAGAVLEGFVAFSAEVSVVIARNLSGETACYCPVENRHTDHILDITIAPAPYGSGLMKTAGDIATRIAGALDYVGILAVEMFVTETGGILVNEIAPRPHNSGHWTLDACLVSQFEQAIRAVCNLPLGNPERHSDAEMKNLLGTDINGYLTALSRPDTALHLYGKHDARAGRKMGHVTRLFPKSGIRHHSLKNPPDP